MRSAMALVLLLAAAAGCGGRSAAEPAGGGKPEAVTVTVANVAVRSVERTVSVVGTLAANAQAEVASEVEGQVAATLADLGDRVAESHVLARVRRDEIEARLREAEASLAKAAGDATRAEPLRAGGVISTQEYEQVRMALDVARARRDQLRIQLEHTDIRAPMDASVAASARLRMPPRARSPSRRWSPTRTTASAPASSATARSSSRTTSARSPCRAPRSPPTRASPSSS